MPEVRLSDVAREVGMSVSTVSRALNCKSECKNSKRTRILQIAEEMGYRKKNQPLGPKGIGRIALVNVGIAEADSLEPVEYTLAGFFASLIYGAERSVREAGGTLTVFNLDKTPDVISHIRNIIDEYGFSGVLLSVNGDLEDISTIHPTCPIVHMNSPQGIIQTDSVASDDYGGMSLATKRLIEMGHRRIAVLTDWPCMPFHHRSRLNGYRDTMQSFGIQYEHLYMMTPNGFTATLDVVRAAFAGYHKDPHPPTAVLCVTDGYALSLLRVALECGLDIPGDLSIVGFDNLPGSRFSHPGLSTVDAHLSEMPRLAVELLQNRMLQPDAPCRQYTVQSSFIERESAAPI